jgi:hypothetical protein
MESVMKILMLRNPSRSYGCDLMEGETGEVEDSLANKLIDAKIAEPAPVEEKKVKGVAKTPEIKGE